MSRTRVQELMLPAGLLISLLVILMPMPPLAMDLMLLANIALSVIIFLTTIYVSSPLEFSVFPTVLLATTLVRLVLNIATTRLILTQGPVDGLDAAGGVVRRFGEFVAGDQVLVGLVIFGIIAVIQFVVITKGATRISEVSARFALDGLPGKQMAVDADLNAGAIDEAEAKRRRADVSRQADFYGAMDGASKFVRGDAVASVFITAINIVGGLAIGLGQYQMSLADATATFTKLTIGDGLVSQLPALLISLAAGLLVTRSTQKSNLPVEFLQQMLFRPQVLAVAGVFLAVLVLTQLPAIPLVVLGSSCLGAAVMLSRRPEETEKQPRVAAAPTPAAAPQRLEPRIEEYLSVDPVELELGLDLVRLADSKRGGNLLSRITQLRQSVAMELGLVLPKVRIRDNLKLAEDQYRIKIHGNSVATAKLPSNYFWAVGETRGDVRGADTTLRHPAFKHPLQRLTREQLPLAQQSGVTILDATGVLLQHLRQVVGTHASDLLTRDATKHLLDETRQQSPAVVDELIPQFMRLADVQRILQRLLVEGVSIRQMNVILEALGDEAGRCRSEVELAERVRCRMARSICAQYRDDRERLHVVSLDSAWEERILNVMHIGERDVAAKLAPADVDVLARSIDAELAALRQQGRPEVLLVRPEIRPATKRILSAHLPHLVVLSEAEVTDETKVVSVGIVSGMRGK